MTSQDLPAPTVDDPIAFPILAEAGSRATFVIRADDIEKSMSRYLVDRIRANSNQTVSCVGLFSFIGADPASGWLSGCAVLDGRGFVVTDCAPGAGAV